VLVVEGANFGGDASLCTITLVSLDGSDTQACNVCYIDRTKQSLARCITSAGRDKAFDLTVQVVDQVSSSVLYDYRILVQVPSFSLITPLLAPRRAAPCWSSRAATSRTVGSLRWCEGLRACPARRHPLAR